jgi:hypothetical protein
VSQLSSSYTTLCAPLRTLISSVSAPILSFRDHTPLQQSHPSLPSRARPPPWPPQQSRHSMRAFARIRGRTTSSRRVSAPPRPGKSHRAEKWDNRLLIVDDRLLGPGIQLRHTNRRRHGHAEGPRDVSPPLPPISLLSRTRAQNQERRERGR